LTNNHNIAWQSGMIDAYDEVPRLLTARQLLDSEAGDFLALEMIHEIEQLLQMEEVAAGLEFVTAFPSESEQRVAIYRRLP
jgi:hypothetical protein